MNLIGYLEGVHQPPELTVRILVQEIGRVMEQQNYREEGRLVAYSNALLRTELSDVLTMTRLLIEQEGFDYEELLREGEEKFIERITERKTRDPKSEFGDRELKGLKITRAERSFGTDRVMLYGPDGYCLRSLSGKQYSEVKDSILKLSDSETKFFHRIPSDDPIQPVKEVEVSREEWFGV